MSALGFKKDFPWGVNRISNIQTKFDEDFMENLVRQLFGGCLNILRSQKKVSCP